MGAQGQGIIDFGAFPGSDIATLVITGQAAILAGSLCEAWLDATASATTDHSVDEHIAESGNMTILCKAIVAGTGFTIVAKTVMDTAGINIYGKWNVAWVWN